MKTDPVANVLSRINDVVQRETGAALSPEGMEKILAIVAESAGTGSAPPDLSVEPREVTILLADLRGFMALTATLPAGAVIDMLNQCLDRLSTLVHRHHGTIDKFMGDAVMVLFGVPAARGDDVFRALSCAVEMQIAIRDLNAGFRSQGLPELHLGIGVNTGTVMAGRFGSQAYSEYTVIGEEVNLASRIEAFSLRGQILISEKTWSRCKDRVAASEPMEVHVKGRKEPVRLRELIGIPGRNLSVPRQEVRRSHRVEVRLPCTVRRIENKIVMAHATEALIRDIGYHGVLLELDEKLEDRGEVKLEFDLPLVDFRAAEIYARTVNLKSTGGRCLAGVEFTSLDPRTNEKIQVFVQFLVAAQ
jgi:adenylate cyclase